MEGGGFEEHKRIFLNVPNYMRSHRKAKRHHLGMGLHSICVFPGSKGNAQKNPRSCAAVKTKRRKCERSNIKDRRPSKENRSRVMKKGGEKGGEVLVRPRVPQSLHGGLQRVEMIRPIGTKLAFRNKLQGRHV